MTIQCIFDKHVLFSNAFMLITLLCLMYKHHCCLITKEENNRTHTHTHTHTHMHARTHIHTHRLYRI